MYTDKIYFDFSHNNNENTFNNCNLSIKKPVEL